MDKEFIKKNLNKIVFGLIDYDPEEVASILSSDDELSEEYQKIRKIKLLFEKAARYNLRKKIIVFLDNEIRIFDKKDIDKIALPIFTAGDQGDKYVMVIRDGDIILEETFSPEDYSFSMAADSGETTVFDDEILLDQKEEENFERNLFYVPSKNEVILQIEFN